MVIVLILLVISVLINLYILFKPRKYDGAIVYDVDSEDRITYTLEIGVDPYLMKDMTAVVFKVIENGQN